MKVNFYLIPKRIPKYKSACFPLSASAEKTLFDPKKNPPILNPIPLVNPEISLDAKGTKVSNHFVVNRGISV